MSDERASHLRAMQAQVLHMLELLERICHDDDLVVAISASHRELFELSWSRGRGPARWVYGPLRAKKRATYTAAQLPLAMRLSGVDLFDVREALRRLLEEQVAVAKVLVREAETLLGHGSALELGSRVTSAIEFAADVTRGPRGRHSRALPKG